VGLRVSVMIVLMCWWLIHKETILESPTPWHAL